MGLCAEIRRRDVLLGVAVLFSTALGLVGGTILQGEALLEVARDWNISSADSPAYGTYLVTWVPGTDPCVALWAGTNCSGGSEVIGLNLTQGGLRGPVPLAMSRMTSLQTLDLSSGSQRFYQPTNNFITGDLQPLAFLTNLTYLNLGRNTLGVKVFPEAIKKLTNLKTLMVDNTLIEGTFPDLTSLTKLEQLYMGNNSFGSPFPTSLTQMTSLKELTIWGNNFTDVLPPALANLTNLTYLNCNRCKLYGGLPPELGKLKNIKRFHLYKNDMTGPIPKEYLAWKSVAEIRIELNYFYGNFSGEFFRLVNLSKLTMNNMQLIGPLPTNLTNATVPKLKSLALSCNYFTGVNPTLSTSLASGDDLSIGPLAFNCFDRIPASEDGEDTRCARKLSCLPFQDATKNGQCPPCPSRQKLYNANNCICMPGNDSGSKTWVAPVVGVVVATSILVVALVVFGILTRCFQHKPFDKTRDIFGKKRRDEYYDPNWKVPPGLRLYTLEELSHLTDDFNESRVVGRGGFGKVYRGTLANGKEVAIKRSSNSTEFAQGIQEFRNEIDLLSRLHHRNLVKLQGFCDEEGMQILVYEYMRHGNLHMILFRDDVVHYMDWYKRLEIAVETAQGLEYLHHHADPSVIHRDVKPGNILLNEYFQAKVADFGISRESAELDTHVSTNLAGTAGYFDPQYFLNRQLTKASDVYSYGVCLLELITGQRAIDHARDKEANLIEWAKPRLNKLGLEAIVDPRLKGDYPPAIFLDMANLAIMCSLFDKNDRPTMREVVAALEPQLKAAKRPPQWELPLKTIPEFFPPKDKAAGPTPSTDSSYGLSKKLLHGHLWDSGLPSEACTSASITTVQLEAR